MLNKKNIMRVKTKEQKRMARARKTHAKACLSGRARLVVYRSNKAIYAQIVDSQTGDILCGASSINSGAGIEGASAVGKAIAKKAQEKKITTVTFDRNGYRYHGRIKALADGARESGLKF